MHEQETFKECEKEAKLKPFAKAALAAAYERIDPVVARARSCACLAVPCGVVAYGADGALRGGCDSIGWHPDREAPEKQT